MGITCFGGGGCAWGLMGEEGYTGCAVEGGSARDEGLRGWVDDMGGIGGLLPEGSRRKRSGILGVNSLHF